MHLKESRYLTNAIYNNKNQNIKLIQPKIEKSSHAIKNQIKTHLILKLINQKLSLEKYLSEENLN